MMVLATLLFLSPLEDTRLYAQCMPLDMSPCEPPGRARLHAAARAHEVSTHHLDSRDEPAASAKMLFVYSLVVCHARSITAVSRSWTLICYASLRPDCSGISYENVSAQHI